MKKEFTLGQLLSVAVTLLIAIVTGWVTLNGKVSADSERIKAVEARQTRVESAVDKMSDKIDRIYEKVVENDNSKKQHGR